MRSGKKRYWQKAFSRIKRVAGRIGFWYGAYGEIGFYEYMGFKTYKRKELDEQENPYPILYMKLDREIILWLMTR